MPVQDMATLRALKIRLECMRHRNRWCFVLPNGEHVELDIALLTLWAKYIVSLVRRVSCNLLTFGHRILDRPHSTLFLTWPRSTASARSPVPRRPYHRARRHQLCTYISRRTSSRLQPRHPAHRRLRPHRLARLRSSSRRLRHCPVPSSRPRQQLFPPMLDLRHSRAEQHP
jgi:hypothetical protein